MRTARHVAMLLLLTTPVAARTAEHRQRVSDTHAQSRRHDVPLGIRTLAGVTLNRDSAATIRSKLGPTRERTVGTGHDVMLDWCYLPRGTAPGALLELMSDASDMGTPGRALNVIRVRVSAPATDRTGCAPLSASARLSTPARLRLGSTMKQVETLLGPPTRRAADSLVYVYDAKEYMRPGTPEYETWNTPEYRESCFDAGPPYVNIAGWVVLLLRDDRVVELRLERYDQSVC
jgi:hypothetical protein